MSPKVFLILIALLAVACFVGAGAGMFGGQSDADGSAPSAPGDNWIASALGSVLAPFSPKLDLGGVRPRQGTGFELDPAKGSLTLQKATVCRLEIPADADRQVRTARLSVSAGTAVEVLYWGADDERPDGDQAQLLKQGGEPLSLAVLEAGGSLEIRNPGVAPSILRFE